MSPRSPRHTIPGVEHFAREFAASFGVTLLWPIGLFALFVAAALLLGAPVIEPAPTESLPVPQNSQFPPLQQ